MNQNKAKLRGAKEVRREKFLSTMESPQMILKFSRPSLANPPPKSSFVPRLVRTNELR